MSFSGFASIFGLLGLLSLPIIFILHLLRERSKRHVVSSLSLWSFLEVEVRGSLPKRIPLTWLLVLHLLIAALLSFACSQPKVVMATKVKQARHMVVLLDVSESMLAHDVLPSRLDQAKLEADSLLGGLGPKDIATIVTFGGKTHWIGDTRQTSLQDIFTQISSIEAGEIGNNLEDALASSVSVLDQSLPAELHVLTDAAFAEPNFVEGSTYSIKWHLYGRSKSNQAVLGISTAPGGNSHGSDEIQVLARFGNFSDQSVQRVATLLADGKPVDSMPLQMEADSTIAQVWTVFGRPSSLTAKLVGGDDLPQDDSASLGMFYGDKVKVALVTENPYPLDQALRSIPWVDLRVLRPDEYHLGMPYDLILFRGELPEKWPTGTLLVFEPPLGSDLLPVKGLEPVTSLPVPVENPIFSGVDFSGVRWSKAWTLTDYPDGFNTLLQSGELPLLVEFRDGFSHIYLILADLGSGNLTRHPSFPILLANLMQTQLQLSLPDQIQVGEILHLPEAEKYPIVQITSPDEEKVVFEKDRPADWELPKKPGIYHFDLIDLDGHHQVLPVGVNAGSQTESDIRPGDWPENWGDDLTGAEVYLKRELNLMPWLVALCILLLILEASLAWR